MKQEAKIREQINRYVASAIGLISNGDLFEIIPLLGVIVEKSTGNIVGVNDTFCKQLGYTKEEVRGNSITRILLIRHVFT